MLRFFRRQMRRVLFYSTGLVFVRGKMRRKRGMTQQATNFYFFLCLLRPLFSVKTQQKIEQKALACNLQATLLEGEKQILV